MSKDKYICPRAGSCEAYLCTHRLPHDRDNEGERDYCAKAPAWARPCPDCKRVKG